MKNKRTLAAVAAAAIVASSLFASATPTLAAEPATTKPTIVLVHGAFADSSSWSAEIRRLRAHDYPVVAVANPLRGLKEDTSYLVSVLKTIDGPVVLVGHSYAGMVISQAAAKVDNVDALVYVAAFIPKKGESAGELNAKYPGSLLTADNLIARSTAGGTDLYIQPKAFRKVYAGGLSASEVTEAAIEQRPITSEALGDKATVSAPASIEKWQIVATKDHAVPTKLQEYVAKRAHAHIVLVASGHDVPAARPGTVSRVIFRAAQSIND